MLRSVITMRTPAAIFRRASLPSTASITSYPPSDRVNETICRTLAESSTVMIVLPISHLIAKYSLDIHIGPFCGDRQNIRYWRNAEFPAADAPAPYRGAKQLQTAEIDRRNAGGVQHGG